MADSLRASLFRREVLTERDDDQHHTVSARRCVVPPTGRSGRRAPVASTLPRAEVEDFQEETVARLWRRFAQLAVATFGRGWIWRLTGGESIDESERLTLMREHKRTVGLRPTNCFESVLLNAWFIPTEGEPTDTQPGSLARVLVFCQRLERGEQLFHPADRHCFDDGSDLSATLGT